MEVGGGRDRVGGDLADTADQASPAGTASALRAFSTLDERLDINITMCLDTSIPSPVTSVVCAALVKKWGTTTRGWPWACTIRCDFFRENVARRRGYPAGRKAVMPRTGARTVTISTELEGKSKGPK